MYAKLIFRNAKRSVRDYSVYIVTMTICVTLFYSFLSISSRYYRPDIGSEYDFTVLSDGMKAAICVITLLLLFLIRFTNRYMLRRRQREFGIQFVMGMEQTVIAGIFFAETFLMGIFSVFAGILFGMFFSQFMTAMLLTSYGKSYQVSWMLFPDTVLLTVVFFTASFFAVGLFNVRTIRKTKIIDMLSAEKENEPEPEKSRWIRAAAIFYEVSAVCMTASGIQAARLYYDVRLAFPVRIMLLGNIIFPAVVSVWTAYRTALRRGKKKDGFQRLISGLLLCAVLNTFAAAGVPVMTRMYDLPVSGGMLSRYMLFILLDLLFFICFFIFLAGSFIATWKKKSPEHRYKNENLFFFGQILSGLNTASQSMTMICLTFVLSVFLSVAAPVLTGWASGYLDVRSMYDVQISSQYNDVYREEDLAAASGNHYGAVTDFLEERGIKAVSDLTFSLYLPCRDDFYNRSKYDFPVAAISLSDYNEIRKMLGYEPVTLSENEFATQWKSVATDEERDSWLNENRSIVTDAGKLSLSGHPFYEEAIGETAYNSYTDVLCVFPDSVCEKLLPVIQNRYIMTEEKISYRDARELEHIFTEEYPEMTEKGVSYAIRLSTLQINSAKANNFVLKASMIYAAVVLMVICLTVLSLQQLYGADQHRYRFSVLRKIGVEEKRINRLILKQLGVWFGLPLATAAAAAAAASMIERLF